VRVVLHQDDDSLELVVHGCYAYRGRPLLRLSYTHIDTSLHADAITPVSKLVLVLSVFTLLTLKILKKINLKLITLIKTFSLFITKNVNITYNEYNNIIKCNTM